MLVDFLVFFFLAGRLYEVDIFLGSGPIKYFSFLVQIADIGHKLFAFKSVTIIVFNSMKSLFAF